MNNNSITSTATAMQIEKVDSIVLTVIVFACNNMILKGGILSGALDVR